MVAGGRLGFEYVSYDVRKVINDLREVLSIWLRGDKTETKRLAKTCLAASNLVGEVLSSKLAGLTRDWKAELSLPEAASDAQIAYVRSIGSFAEAKILYEASAAITQTVRFVAQALPKYEEAIHGSPTLFGESLAKFNDEVWDL